MTTSITLIADGERSLFEFPFRIFATHEVFVSLDDEPTNNFSVIGRSIQLTTPPTTGTRVTIRRELDFLRESRFRTGGVFRAEDLNDEIAYTRACMEQINAVLRSITSILDVNEVAYTMGMIHNLVQEFNTLDEKVAAAEDAANSAEAAFHEITELLGSGPMGIDFGTLSP